MAYAHDLPYGPNAEQIRAQASRVIRGKMPMQVRRELMDAVKQGYLGRLKKNGLAPEIFFHPDHKNGAIERQRRELEYSANLIKGVCVSQEEKIDNMLAKQAAE